MKELIDFIVLIILYFTLFYKKWNAKGKDTLLINTLMYIYLSFVLYFTLMPIVIYLPRTFISIVFSPHHKSMNLVPFIDVSLGRGDFIRQIVLNIIMTIPFGFLLSLIKKEHAKLTKILFYTFLLSLSIEFLQLFINSGRSSDITDIITNVTGGFIGFVIYILLRPITTKILDSLKNK